MPSWLDIEGGAEAVRPGGELLSRIGAGVGEPPAPPEPVWGDDDFGAAMRAAYPAHVGLECRVQLQALGTRLAALGEAVVTAVTELTEQDRSESTAFTALPAPRV